jgi:hypothetical protein
MLADTSIFVLQGLRLVLADTDGIEVVASSPIWTRRSTRASGSLRTTSAAVLARASTCTAPKATPRASSFNTLGRSTPIRDGRVSGSRSSSRARAERERMTADAELLAEALRHDLIGPDDFMVAAARVR